MAEDPKDTPELLPLLKQHGLKPTEYEGPGSFATYLLRHAPTRGVEMLSIAAEIPAYAPPMSSAKTTPVDWSSTVPTSFRPSPRPDSANEARAARSHGSGSSRPTAKIKPRCPSWLRSTIRRHLPASPSSPA